MAAHARKSGDDHRRHGCAQRQVHHLAPWQAHGHEQRRERGHGDAAAANAQQAGGKTHHTAQGGKQQQELNGWHRMQSFVGAQLQRRF